MHRPCQKIVRKINFFKFFFDFHNHHTSDYMHAKFRQNRTIFDFQTVWCTVHLKNQKLSDFDEIWHAYSLKYVDYEKQKKILRNLFFGQIFVMNGALCACTT